ncbi:MAG: hypothetical protein BMS9Abin08_1347 [Gammaproteobacteria bacterium]|nr:MAG: hypothetical protein BMS9Abin08_1347 [Gammaproteobacteria bacterium]
MKDQFIKRVLLCVFSTVLSVHTVSASPVISELFYDASGTDAGQVFVELFGMPGESLDGLVLEGVNGTGGTVYGSLDLSGEVIPGDGVFVIGDDNGGSTSVPNADLIADIDYQNGPDSVVLRSGSLILDAVGYGSFTGASIFAGEGAAAPDPASGSSIARFNPLLDSGDNSLDFVVLEMPTPGVVPLVSSVPLPAGIWLFISGLLPLVSSRFLRRGGHSPAAA